VGTIGREPVQPSSSGARRPVILGAWRIARESCLVGVRTPIMVGMPDLIGNVNCTRWSPGTLMVSNVGWSTSCNARVGNAKKLGPGVRSSCKGDAGSTGRVHRVGRLMYAFFGTGRFAGQAPIRHPSSAREGTIPARARAREY
jgi:hypothetical protein